MLLLYNLATDDCLCCGKTSVHHHMFFTFANASLHVWVIKTVNEKQQQNWSCGWFSYSVLYFCTVFFFYSSLFLFIWTIQYNWIRCVAYFYDFIFLACVFLIVSVWNVVYVFVFAEYFLKKIHLKLSCVLQLWHIFLLPCFGFFFQCFFRLQCLQYLSEHFRCIFIHLIPTCILK